MRPVTLVQLGLERLRLGLLLTAVCMVGGLLVLLLGVSDNRLYLGVFLFAMALGVPALQHLQAKNRSLPTKLVAHDLAIKGTIQGAGHVRISAHFIGNVAIGGSLTIEAGGKVTGDVSAQSVIVYGDLHGNVRSAEFVEIRGAGLLRGAILVSKYVMIEPAARGVEGRIEFQPAEGTLEFASAAPSWEEEG